MVSELFNMAMLSMLFYLKCIHNSISSQRISYDFLSLSWPPGMNQPRWKTLQILSEKPYNIIYSNLVALIEVNIHNFTPQLLHKQLTQSSFFSQIIFFFFFLLQHVQILLNRVVG